MTLLLLAAGFATRLGEKFNSTPKHLLPCGEKLLIDLLLEPIIPAIGGSTRKVLISNARNYERFRSWARKNQPGVGIISDGVRSKDKRLGAVGDFLFAVDKARIKDDIFACAADYALPEFDFKKMLADFEAGGDSMTVAAPEEDENVLKAGSCLEFDRAGKVTKFEEKPQKPFSKFYGVPYYFIKQKDLEIIRQIPKKHRDNAGQIIAALVADSRVYCRKYSGRIIHLTNVSDFEKLNPKTEPRDK